MGRFAFFQGPIRTTNLADPDGMDARAGNHSVQVAVCQAALGNGLTVAGLVRWVAEKVEESEESEETEDEEEDDED